MDLGIKGKKAITNYKLSELQELCKSKNINIKKIKFQRQRIQKMPQITKLRKTQKRIKNEAFKW